MRSSSVPKSGFYGFLVVCVVIGAPSTFFLGYELLAFLIIGIATFLMIASGVAVIVLMNNRQHDAMEANEERKDKSP
jgi:hypothetical protein